MKHAITVEIDADVLPHLEDGQLALLWHVSQANPAPWGDRAAGEIVAKIAHEIIRRWLRAAPLELYRHQEVDEFHKQRIDSIPPAAASASSRPC